jgi:hypothetical protein
VPQAVFSREKGQAVGSAVGALVGSRNPTRMKRPLRSPSLRGEVKSMSPSAHHARSFWNRTLPTDVIRERFIELRCASRPPSMSL